MIPKSNNYARGHVSKYKYYRGKNHLQYHQLTGIFFLLKIKIGIWGYKGLYKYSIRYSVTNSTMHYTPLPTEEEDKDRVVGMASMSFYKYISIKNKHLVKNKLLG